MANLNDGERLVALETKMDIVIQQQQDTNKKLDVLLPTFVTKSEFDKELNAIKKRTWIQNTLSAILGAVLAILVGFFLTHI